MTSTAWRLRSGVLLLVGALVVHQLRYLLTGHTPDEHAHLYLAWLLPIACALLVLLAAELAARAWLRARTGAHSPQPRGIATRWLGATGVLLAIFAAQESAEFVAAHGHLHVSDALIGHGAWLALPLALLVGGAVALGLRGAGALLAGPRERARNRRHAQVSARRPARPGAVVKPAVMARHLAGRAPPAS